MPGCGLAPGALFHCVVNAWLWLSFSVVSVLCALSCSTIFGRSFVFCCLNFCGGGVRHPSEVGGMVLLHLCANPLFGIALPPPRVGLDAMSESHCTYPTEGLLIRHKHKKTYPHSYLESRGQSVHTHARDVTPSRA